MNKNKNKRSVLVKAKEKKKSLPDTILEQKISKEREICLIFSRNRVFFFPFFKEKHNNVKIIEIINKNVMYM